MDFEDECEIAEISILPDGRVCLFGASQQVLELFDAINLGDPALKSRIERLCAADASQGASGGTAGLSSSAWQKLADNTAGLSSSAWQKLDENTAGQASSATRREESSDIVIP